jgi:hypothetical protein
VLQELAAGVVSKENAQEAPRLFLFFIPVQRGRLTRNRRFTIRLRLRVWRQHHESIRRNPQISTSQNSVPSDEERLAKLRM